MPSLHGAARRQGHRRGRPDAGDQRQPVAPDDRRRAAAAAAPRGRAPARSCSSVRDLSLAKEDPFGTRARGDLVRGARRRDRRHRRRLGQRPAGADGGALGRGPARAAPDSIRLFDRDIARAVAAPAPRAGLHFVPEERLGRGAVPTLSLAQNTLLTRTERGRRAAAGSRIGDVAALAEALIRRFNVKAGGPGSAAKSLSGGNLQKFIVGREIDAQPKLLIVSQPTWGVDVGAAAQIRGELLALRDAGCARAGRQRGARRAVRDLRPAASSSRRAASRRACATRRGDGRADRRMDERPVGPRRRGGEPC